MAYYGRPGCEPTADTVRILIAEDEPMIAMSMSDLLEEEGYAVSVTSDGVEALAEVRRLGSKLSVLVTDLNMPRMSGEDLIIALQMVQPELPIIVVSGSAPRGGLEELRCYGGGQEPFALLHKPIEYGNLLAAVQCAVLTKQNRRVACIRESR